MLYEQGVWYGQILGVCDQRGVVCPDLGVWFGQGLILIDSSIIVFTLYYYYRDLPSYSDNVHVEVTSVKKRWLAGDDKMGKRMGIMV